VASDRVASHYWFECRQSKEGACSRDMPKDNFRIGTFSGRISIGMSGATRRMMMRNGVLHAVRRCKPPISQHAASVSVLHGALLWDAVQKGAEFKRMYRFVSSARPWMMPARSCNDPHVPNDRIALCKSMPRQTSDEFARRWYSNSRMNPSRDMSGCRGVLSIGGPWQETLEGFHFGIAQRCNPSLRPKWFTCMVESRFKACW
jgi:hypothetical protein